MDTGTLATVGAAVATAISAGVIALQAVETRKSTREAQRAADASERALEVANASLAIAQRQSSQGQFTALEAMRARLDDMAPVAWVKVLSDQPECYVMGDSSSEQAYKEVPVGTIFQIPQEEERWLYAVYHVLVTNSAPVSLSSHPGFFTHRDQVGISVGQAEMQLSDGKKSLRYLLVGAQMSRWVYGAENDRHGHTVCGEGGWSTMLQTDKGVVLSQQMQIRGSIIHQVGLGKWELRGVTTDVNHAARFQAQRVERLYFIGDEELPEVDVNSLG